MVKSEIISKLSKKIHQKLKKSELEEILNIILETINETGTTVLMASHNYNLIKGRGRPIFELKNVPEGTKELRFKMKDKDVPGYNHGGGKIKDYNGNLTIQPGAFKYKSPCPPDGSHTYEWTITAIGEKKKKLGKAKATKNYP